MDQESLAETRPAGSNVYAFNGQMLAVAAISTVFFFVFLIVSLHLYARWWLRRAAASRRRTHVVVLSDPGSSAEGGLDPSVLSSLPVFAFSSKAAPAPERALLECAVCLSEFEEEETVRLLPRCNHAFHIECIDMWFHSHTTCPLCRSPVEPAAEPVVSGAEPGSSSGCDLCATCQHAERGSGGGGESAASYGSTASFRRRKAMDVRIDVGPAEFEGELTQGSELVLCGPWSTQLGGHGPTSN